MFNSAEREILNANKYKNIKKFRGILTFVSTKISCLAEYIMHTEQNKTRETPKSQFFLADRQKAIHNNVQEMRTNKKLKKIPSRAEITFRKRSMAISKYTDTNSKPQLKLRLDTRERWSLNAQTFVLDSVVAHKNISYSVRVF